MYFIRQDVTYAVDSVGFSKENKKFLTIFFGMLLISICFPSFPSPLLCVTVSHIGSQIYRPMTCSVAMPTVRGSLFLLLRVKPRAVTCVR